MPETASEKGVRYAIVSGPEIVTLHHDGTVTGKAVGTAKILSLIHISTISAAGRWLPSV